MRRTRGMQRSICAGFVHWLIDAGVVEPKRLSDEEMEGLTEEQALELERVKTANNLVESYFTDVRKDGR